MVKKPINDTEIIFENKKFIDNLNNLVKQIKYDIDHGHSKTDKLKNMFRLKHIKHAIKVISNFPTEIKSGKDLEKIKGIGKGIMERIDEIIKTGKLGEIHLTHLSDKYLQYVDELEQVFGIGRVKAIELINVYNIKSVDELKQAVKNNKIDLPENIIMGLKYYGIYKQQIPRSEVLEYDLVLHKILEKIDKQLIGVICGSYRRLAKESNDIDLLLVHPNINTINHVHQSNILLKIVDQFKKENIIIDSLTDPDTATKFMGFCQLNNKNVRRIDIRFMPYESYYTSLLYFTGSGDFNRKMRLLAIQLDYKLNEYGLYKILKNDKYKKIPISSEKDVFDYLGMEYLEPQFRK
jgi:DNA polymerase/3'-5' exonuclease PolX